MRRKLLSVLLSVDMIICSACTETTDIPETSISEITETISGEITDNGEKQNKYSRKYLKKDSTESDECITVEYNKEKEYVTLKLDFMGKNAYLTPDCQNMRPIDGSYFIQDFCYGEKNPPRFIDVYLEYTDEKIVLYFYDDIKMKYDREYPLIFNFDE